MKVYVTGGTGFVGSNIVKVAAEEHGAAVFTTVHRWQPEGPVPYEYGRVDMTDRDQVLASVRAFRPDAIIHSAILKGFDQMYRDRALAWRAYVDSTRHLTEAANEIGAKMILISSDWVFDGTQSNADEATPPNPVNLYGLLKVVGETVVLEAADNGAVARISGVNGVHWARPEEPQTQNVGYGSLIGALLETAGRGQPFVMWHGEINMHATLSLASESARMMMRIIERDGRGIFHCCSGASLSRMQAVRTAAEVFELDAGLISTGPPSWVGMAGAQVPHDTSMSAVATAERLDYRLPSAEELLGTYRREWEAGALSAL